MTASEQSDPSVAFERIPFTVETRRRVRGRFRGLAVGIGFVLVIAAGLMVMIALDKSFSAAATLGLCLGAGVIALLVIVIIARSGRSQLHDLREGYLLRYHGPAVLSFHRPAGGRGGSFLTVACPERRLTTSRGPFIVLGLKQSIGRSDPYVVTVDFTPHAGDILSITTLEFGTVEA